MVHPGGGTEKFYEITALTFPVLLLAIVIDARMLTRREVHPALAWANLAVIALGFTAALVAIDFGEGTRFLFAADTAATIAIIVAIAVASASDRAAVNGSSVRE